MSAPTLPLIIEPKELESLLGHPDILVVDLCKAENYQKYHIKGAVRLEYSSLVKAEKPVVGMLPDVQTLTQIFSDIGISPNKQVILYDDEGNGMACRTGWTLEACGFTRFSILNGGLVAWINEGHSVENQNREPTPATFVAQATDAPVASKPYILGQLSNPNVRLLDARSPEEYRGEKKLADRAGHIVIADSAIKRRG